MGYAATFTHDIQQLSVHQNYYKQTTNTAKYISSNGLCVKVDSYK